MGYVLEAVSVLCGPHDRIRPNMLHRRSATDHGPRVNAPAHSALVALSLVFASWVALGSFDAQALEIRGRDDTRTVIIGNTKMLRSDLVCPTGAMAGSGVDATLEWADLSYRDAASCLLENAETLTPAETVTWFRNMNLRINPYEFEVEEYPALVSASARGMLIKDSRPFYQRILKIYSTDIKIRWDKSGYIYWVNINGSTL